MRAVSAEFLESVHGSHQLAVKGLLLTTFQTGAEPTGTALTIIEGGVQLAYGADIRATLDITIDGTGWSPHDSSDPLLPYGNEIWVARGVDYGGGNTELVPLGYFRIEEPEQDLPPDGPLHIACSDRMASIIEGRFLTPKQFGPTVTFTTAVTTLITEVYPAATIEFDDTLGSQQLGRTLYEEQDRYAMLSDMLTARGKIFYFDYRGVLVIKSPPSVEPVATITSGRDGTLVTVRRRVSRVGSPNAIVATGESQDETPPVRGVAIDDNANSPTYYYGPYGPVVDYFSSPLLTSDDMATKAARTILNQRLGVPYNVDFGMVVNPAFDPGDTVYAHYSDREGTEIHVLDILGIPLHYGDTMSAATRQQPLR